MTSGQKVAASLLISVVLFAVFTVLAFAGLFEFVEAKFYQPMVVDGIESRLVKISDAQERYVESLFKRFGSFVLDETVRTYADARRSDTARYGRYFRHMLDRGVYLAPAQFEAMFLGACHTDEDVDRTIEAAKAFRG